MRRLRATFRKGHSIATERLSGSGQRGERPTGVSEDGYPRPRRAWTVVWLLLLAYIFAVVDRQILSLLVQPIRRDLDITDTEVSLLHGFAFVVTFTVLGVVMGRVADRGKRRNMIVIGMATWCLATIMCGFARNFSELFIARMMVGVGEAALSPAAYSLIADYFPPERRGRAMGVYTMGAFLGSGLAMIVGALAILLTGSTVVHVPLLGEIASWKAAFIFVGIPGLGIAAAMLLVREPVRQERAEGVAKPSNTFAFIRRNALVFTITIAGFSLNGLANFSLISWSPTFFIRVFGWQPGTIGVVYGLILIGPGAFGIMLSGWLSDRMARQGRQDSALLLSRIAIALVIPSAAWVGLAPNPGVALVALSWCTFLLAIPAGLGPVTIYRLTPNEHRGQLIAIYLLVATLLGVGGGPTLVAMTNDFIFQDDASIGKSMAIVATIAAICCFCGLTLASSVIKRREGTL